MKFMSKAQNITFTVIPGRVEERAGRLFHTQAIRARFYSGQFDSEAAQFAYSWTEEDRKMVEEYLQSTRDFRNRELWLATEQWVPVPEGAPNLAGECRFTRRVGDESVACGKPLAESSELFCDEHDALLSTVAETSPNKVKQRGGKRVVIDPEPEPQPLPELVGAEE